MFGTLVNAAAVVAGTLIGMLLKKGISERIHQSLNKMLGISTILIGISGVLSSSTTVNANGKFESSDTLLMIVSLSVGMLIGEMLNLDERLNGLGAMLERKLKLQGAAKGFVDASIIFCVGAMAVVGSLQDGLGRGSEILLIKSTLDFTVCIILASSLGAGVALSAVSVLIYQGSIALLAGFLQPILEYGSLLDQICMVGYAIVMCIGINFLEPNKIKTANTLPAIFVPIVYNLPFMLKVF